MLQLFIADKNYSSWSLRPWVLLQTLQIPFEERCEIFESNDNSQKFKKFSPSGKVPCLHDLATDTVVWDSLAIVEYVAEQYPAVWPKDRRARAYARCAAAEMHSGFGVLRTVCSMNVGIRVQLNEVSAELVAEVARLDVLWNQGLSEFGGPFLAGEHFSAVDAFFAPVAFRVQTYGLQLSAPAMAYVERLLALPAMQQWTEQALSDVHREPSHEAWCLTHGRLVADYRK